jgi:Spy/CpxP family protein refolding chaperone|eukprot:COSAG06_NODE_208_length_20182_cov_31.214759_4_plen_98_part_00
MQSEEYLQAQHTTLPAAAATPTAAAAAAAAAAEAADDGGAIQKEETEGEPFLMRFESQKLTDDDIRAIWEKYDTDGSVRRARQCVFFWRRFLAHGSR